MIEFFEKIIDIFETAFSFLLNLISGLVNMITMLPLGVTFVTYATGFLPSVILSFVLAAISIRVIYLIIGRQS